MSDFKYKTKKVLNEYYNFFDFPPTTNAKNKK